MTLLTGIVIGLGSCIATLAWLIWRAPVGYEDSSGFHFGTMPWIDDHGFDGHPFDDAGRQLTEAGFTAPDLSNHAPEVDRA